MILDDLNELSDYEKWEWVIENMSQVELVDEDDIYFIIKDDDNNIDDFELHFNDPIEVSDGISSLLKVIGFESNNY